MAKRKKRKKETAPRKRLVPKKEGRINVRVDNELHLQLIALARKDQRSLSSYLERLLIKHAAEAAKTND